MHLTILIALISTNDKSHPTKGDFIFIKVTLKPSGFLPLSNVGHKRCNLIRSNANRRALKPSLRWGRWREATDEGAPFVTNNDSGTFFKLQLRFLKITSCLFPKKMQTPHPHPPRLRSAPSPSQGRLHVRAPVLICTLTFTNERISTAPTPIAAFCSLP